MTSFNLLWLRNDLRLHDNPLFDQAIDHCQKHGLELAIAFILPELWLKEVNADFSQNNHQAASRHVKPTHLGINRLGLAKAQFLEQCLNDLDLQLQRAGHRLQLLYQPKQAEQLNQPNQPNQQKPVGKNISAVDIIAGLGPQLHTVFTQQAQAPEEAQWLQQLQHKGIRLHTENNQTLFQQHQLTTLTQSKQAWPASFSAFRRKSEKLALQPQPVCDRSVAELITALKPINVYTLPADITSTTTTYLADIHSLKLQPDDKHLPLPSLPALTSCSGSGYNLAGGERAGLSQLQNYIGQYQKG